MIDRAQVETMFAKFAAKDLNAVMAMFAEDAVVFDPHYPIPEMKGKAAIQRGFEWGLGNIEKPGFKFRNFWADGDKAVVEVDTHHVFKGGMELKFPQVFVIETRDGRVTRLQAYVPYPPPGIGGLLAGLTRVIWKLQGKR
ncbi:MAG: nuclear transport factor 2 family protein [Chloroflexi bacterium]|nr:nuclear transport factor 2 family protein [Chloroflexota bacterium]